MSEIEGPNLTAARRTVAALESELDEEMDQADVTALLSLAMAVDSQPTNANLWRQYREAIAALRRRDDGEGGALATLIGRLSAPVVHPPDGEEDAGRPGGSDRNGARPATDAVATARPRRRPRTPA